MTLSRRVGRPSLTRVNIVCIVIHPKSLQSTVDYALVFSELWWIVPTLYRSQILVLGEKNALPIFFRLPLQVTVSGDHENLCTKFDVRKY